MKFNSSILISIVSLMFPLTLSAGPVTDLDCSEREFSYCHFPSQAGMNCAGLGGSCQSLTASDAEDCTIEANISEGNISSCDVCGDVAVSSSVCEALGGSVRTGS